MSYSEDTTDLEMRGIMGLPESALSGAATDTTLAAGRFVPIQEATP